MLCHLVRMGWGKSPLHYAVDLTNKHTWAADCVGAADSTSSGPTRMMMEGYLLVAGAGKHQEKQMLLHLRLRAHLGC